MTETEEWRQIPGFEGLYDVSDQGRVRSWHPWRRTPVPRILKPQPNSDGYPIVRLGRPGEQPTLKVHLLVLLAFVGPLPPGLETRHLDGDCTNDALTNLAYGTHSDNMLDKVRHGTDTNAAKTHCKRGHEFTPENTRLYRGRRHCRTCGRQHVRTRREALR